MSLIGYVNMLGLRFSPIIIVGANNTFDLLSQLFARDIACSIFLDCVLLVSNILSSKIFSFIGILK